VPKIHERDGSRSLTLRGRVNSRSQKRKIAVDNAIQTLSDLSDPFNALPSYRSCRYWDHLRGSQVAK